MKAFARDVADKAKFFSFNTLRLQRVTKKSVHVVGLSEFFNCASFSLLAMRVTYSWRPKMLA